MQLNSISLRILHFYDPGKIKVLYIFVYQSAVMWPGHRKFSSVFSLQFHASHTLVSGWRSTTISMWCQYLWSHIPITKIILIKLLISTKFWEHEKPIISRQPRVWNGNISAQQTYYSKANCVHTFISNWHLPHTENRCSNFSRTKVKIKMHAIKECVDTAVKLSYILNTCIRWK